MVSGSQLQVAKLAQMCPAATSSAQRCPAATRDKTQVKLRVKLQVKLRVKLRVKIRRVKTSFFSGSSERNLEGPQGALGGPKNTLNVMMQLHYLPTLPPGKKSKKNSHI